MYYILIYKGIYKEYINLLYKTLTVSIISLTSKHVKSLQRTVSSGSGSKRVFIPYIEDCI